MSFCMTYTEQKNNQNNLNSLDFIFDYSLANERLFEKHKKKQHREMKQKYKKRDLMRREQGKYGKFVD